MVWHFLPFCFCRWWWWPFLPLTTRPTRHRPGAASRWTGFWAAWRPHGAACLPTVSYTHLDVYKRQVVNTKLAKMEDYPDLCKAEFKGKTAVRLKRPTLLAFAFASGKDPFALYNDCLLYTSRCV